VRTDRIQTRSFQLSLWRWDGTASIRFERWLQQFSGKIKHVPHFIIGRFFPKPCACTFTSEQFHWFIQLRKETLQHFARFWRLFRSVIWSRSILVTFYLGGSLSLFLFLDFIAISACVSIIKTIILLGLARSNNYNHFGATRLVGYLSYPAHPRTQICVYPRAFMTLRVAQCSLKTAHLSFSMGPRGSRAHGLHPGWWLLVLYSEINFHFSNLLYYRKFSRKSRSLLYFLTNYCSRRKF